MKQREQREQRPCGRREFSIEAKGTAGSKMTEN